MVPEYKLPVYDAPIALQVSAIESAEQCTTSVAIPFAPCEGESKVHCVSPDSVSEKLNTNGTFISNEIFGTNADSTPNEDYCIYCYKDGKFTQDMTMEQMIDFCAQFTDEPQIQISAPRAA